MYLRVFRDLRLLDELARDISVAKEFYKQKL